jgi:paraquat-inducible protein B
MAGNGPKLQFQSLPALLEGAVGFETPADLPARPAAKPDTMFALYDSRASAENAPGSQAAHYQVIFHAADAGGLKPGSAVTLDDKRIGTVVDSQLQYDANAKQLETISTLALQPQDIALAGGAPWAADAKPQMDALLRQLIGQGLRARLGSTVPLVGGKTVELAFIPGASPASLSDGDPPAIPTGPGSDITGLMATINTVAEKINAMPLDQIGAEVHDAAQHIAVITGAPEITESLNRLDQALGNIDRLTQQATGQVGPILAEVHRAASEAQSTMEAAHRVIGANPLAPSRPGTAGLGPTLYEVERAARSLRELADYLDRHPEALLHGK